MQSVPRSLGHLPGGAPSAPAAYAGLAGQPDGVGGWWPLRGARRQGGLGGTASSSAGASGVSPQPAATIDQRGEAGLSGRPPYFSASLVS